MSKRGLPVSLKMRHDEHYVDSLASSAGSPIGRTVPIELVEPNPDQPLVIKTVRGRGYVFTGFPQ